MTLSQTDLQQYFSKADPAIQSYLTNDTFNDALRYITTNNNLHLDVARNAENEIVLVLLGLEHPNDLLGNLQNAGVPAKDAVSVLTDIDAKILQPLHNQIVRTHKNRSEPQPTIPHSAIGKRLSEATHVPREEKKIATPNDPYREPIE